MSQEKYDNICGQNISGYAKIISNKEEKQYKNKYIIKFENYKFLLYLDKKYDLEYGDVIFVEGNVEKATSSKNFYIFNYSKYLRQSKIYGVLNINSFEKITKEKDIFYYLEKLKIKLKENLFSAFDEEKAGFLIGLLIGDKSEILDETEKIFRDSSLSHILALSGLHIVYVTLGVQFLLNLLTKRQKLKNCLMIFILIFFDIFTGVSPSCTRACIMSSMVFLSKVVYRKNDFLTTLLISLDILLIINCYNIESIGMWLSFLATIGIVYIKFYSSFSCNLMILPIIWNSYNKLSLTFFISNFFASILIGPIIILGYIHLFLGKFSKILLFIENILLDILFFTSKKIGELKISKIFVPSLNIEIWIIYYLVIFTGIYFYYHKEKLKAFLKFLKDKFYKKSVISFVIITIFGIILIFNNKKNLEIHFLDVAQGDCSLIITPSNKNILIDGGNNEGFDNGENIIVPYLLKNKITKLDYVIISHRRFRPYWRFVLCSGKYEC